MATTPAPMLPAPAAPVQAQPATGQRAPTGFHLPSYLLGLLTALILTGAALFFWPRPQPPAVQLQAPPTLATVPAPTLADAPAAPAAPTHPTPSPLVVFVSGAVAQPGLYKLAPGARVGDALTAAGGLLPAVDMALINQAQPLVDGAQLHIPAPTAAPLPAPLPASAAGPNDGTAAIQPQTEAGTAPTAAAGDQSTVPPTVALEIVDQPAAGLSVPLALPTPTPVAGSTGGSTTRAATVDLPAAGGLINVNTATSAELESLPAIGPTKAQAIIANRPYATVDDLDRVPGIGPATLEQIRPLVTTQ